MGDEPKKSEENPFASPREVASQERPTRPPAIPKLSGPTDFVLTILSMMSAFIAFATSCSIGMQRPRWMPHRFQDTLLYGSPVIGILGGFGMGYVLWSLAKLVRKRSEMWDRQYSVGTAPTPKKGGFHYFGLLGVFGAILVSVIVLPLAIFSDQFRDCLRLFVSYGVLVVSAGGLIAWIGSGIHRLLRWRA